MSSRRLSWRNTPVLAASVALVALTLACTSPGATQPPASPSDVMMEHSPSPTDQMMGHSPSPSDGMMEHSASPAP